jgi:hypothetical protein
MSYHSGIADVCRSHNIPFILTSAINGTNIADTLLLASSLVLRTRRRQPNVDRRTITTIPLPSAPRPKKFPPPVIKPPSAPTSPGRNKNNTNNSNSNGKCTIQ